MDSACSSDFKAFAVVILVGCKRPIELDLQMVDLAVLFVEPGLPAIVRMQSRVLTQDLAVVVHCVTTTFNERYQRSHWYVLGIYQVALCISAFNAWNTRFRHTHRCRYINDWHVSLL